MMIVYEAGTGGVMMLVLRSAPAKPGSFYISMAG